MRGYDHAALHLLRSHRYLRAIVEAAYRLAFWALLELIRGEVQACLHERMIEHCVFFASGHKGEASQIGEHGPSAILSIKPQQGALRRKLVRREVSRDGRERRPQFLSVASVARGAPKEPSHWKLWA